MWNCELRVSNPTVPTWIRQYNRLEPTFTSSDLKSPHQDTAPIMEPRTNLFSETGPRLEGLRVRSHAAPQCSFLPAVFDLSGPRIGGAYIPSGDIHPASPHCGQHHQRSGRITCECGKNIFEVCGDRPSLVSLKVLTVATRSLVGQFPILISRGMQSSAPIRSGLWQHTCKDQQRSKKFKA